MLSHEDLVTTFGGDVRAWPPPKTVRPAKRARTSVRRVPTLPAVVRNKAYVAEARLIDGTPAVLKLLVPRDGDAARNEITVLRLAGGEGCVRLLREDAGRGALLLERLGPRCATSRDVHQPAGREMLLVADRVAGHGG